MRVCNVSRAHVCIHASSILHTCMYMIRVFMWCTRAWICVCNACVHARACLQRMRICLYTSIDTCMYVIYGNVHAARQVLNPRSYLWMCVIHTCTCICGAFIRACTYVCIGVSTCACTCVCMHGGMYIWGAWVYACGAYIHTYIQACVQACNVCMHVSTDACINV